MQALYASSGIVLGHHASIKNVKKLFDTIDKQHMTMASNGKRYIDLAELTAFCEKTGARLPLRDGEAASKTPGWRERQELLNTL